MTANMSAHKYCDLRDSFFGNGREYRVTSCSHIVATWYLTHLRTTALLSYLSLRQLRAILAEGIDQLNDLAKADYLENWRTTND